MADTTIFDLAWLIPFFPLFVFVAIILFIHRSRVWSQRLAVIGIVISAGLALFMFLANMLVVIDGESPDVFQPTFGEWFSLGTNTFLIGIYIDPLNALMLAMLGLACLMIFIYSTGAMQDDPRAASFFALMSLLAACVLGLLIFDNLLLFLVFWVMMDACAYLLVGLGHEQKAAREAALKVFLIAGAGDLLLLFGVALLHFHASSLTYAAVLKDPTTLNMLVKTSFLGTQYPVVAVVALLLFGAAMVKSGQFPFHIWLPEVIEAPAPASAFIHTATAFAGTFLLIRVFPILEAAMGVLLVPELGLTIVAIVGIFTAAFTAIVAVTQRDMRRALSFFAMGQLGYAVAALGMGAYVAGVFHLITGVLSNTLLFLAAGSVTYGMEHGRQEQLEDDFDLSDMFNMGGLGERQPATLLMFVIGGATLVGFPLFTAGFWSKDAILAWTFANNPTVFWVLALTTAVTSFGVMRQLGLIFVGKPRTRIAARVIESTPSMSVPLILTLFVLVIGLIGVPVAGASFLDMFLGFGEEARQTVGGPIIGEPMALWSAVGVLGVAVGFMVYSYAWTPAQADEMDPIESLMHAMWLGWLYGLLRDAFYIGELTHWLAKLTVLLGRGLTLIDGVLDQAAISAVRWLGRAPSLALDWLDVHVLTPLFRPIDRVARPVAQVAGWVDVRLGVPADQLRHAGKYPALVADVLDRLLDRLVNLTKPGTLALARLSAVIDRGLSIMVKSVGHALQVGGLWFRPRTGKVQDYLRLAAIAVVVLVVMFILLLFVQI